MTVKPSSNSCLDLTLSGGGASRTSSKGMAASRRVSLLAMRPEIQLLAEAGNHSAQERLRNTMMLLSHWSLNWRESSGESLWAGWRQLKWQASSTASACGYSAGKKAASKFIVVRLTGCKRKLHRKSVGIDDRMNLAR